MAYRKSASPYPAERMGATKLGQASYGVSVAGIVCGIIIVIIYIGYKYMHSVL